MKAGLYIAGIMLLSILLACGSQEEGAKKMSGTAGELIDEFKAHTKCLVLGEKDGSMLVVTPEYGARIMAVSVAGLNGKNLLWANPKAFTQAYWTQSPRDWNIGGARSWIAPEDLYYLDKEDNWFVPAQMDPGTYQLVKVSGDTVICANEFKIKSRKDADYHVKLVRQINMLGRPADLAASVKFTGFEFTHDLVNLSDKTIGTDLDYMGLWSLIQINPPGSMIIPINGDAPYDVPPYRDYFNVFPPDRISQSNGLISVKIDGKFRGKIGITPWAAKGAFCYLSAGYMIIKEFPVDAEGKYLDHPWGKPSDYGDAVQMYNDDGNMGGFAEMECHAPADIIAPNAKISHTSKVYFFVGENETLIKIAADWLGIDMAQAKIY
ncbi:hypothetical protein JXJ21_23280 [candidate division KSB1 bacterium]|nr:hypothetical protein [candidate division KSB1 bacterium]